MPLAIFAGPLVIGLPVLRHQAHRTDQRRETFGRVAALHTWCGAYQEATGVPPDTQRWKVQLAQLFCKSHAATNDDIQHLADALRDVWGHSLVYRGSATNSTNRFVVYSIGPNGVDEGGDGDDIGVG